MGLNDFIIYIIYTQLGITQLNIYIYIDIHIYIYLRVQLNTVTIYIYLRKKGLTIAVQTQHLRSVSLCHATNYKAISLITK